MIVRVSVPKHESIVVERPSGPLERAAEVVAGVRASRDRFGRARGTDDEFVRFERGVRFGSFAAA